MEERRPPSRLQIAEATAAAVLASAIISTAGGMFWLVVTLPQRLQTLESTVQGMAKQFSTFDRRVEKLEEKVGQQDQRLTRLEYKR